MRVGIGHELEDFFRAVVIENDLVPFDRLYLGDAGNQVTDPVQILLGWTRALILDDAMRVGSPYRDTPQLHLELGLLRDGRIAVERQRYNEAVNSYNTAVRKFPNSLVASFRGLKTTEAYFKSSSGAETAPKVDFGTGEKGRS